MGEFYLKVGAPLVLVLLNEMEGRRSKILRYDLPRQAELKWIDPRKSLVAFRFNQVSGPRMVRGFCLWEPMNTPKTPVAYNQKLIDPFYVIPRHLTTSKRSAALFEPWTRGDYKGLRALTCE